MPEGIARDPAPVRRAPATNGNGTSRVSFSDLVRAHQQWDSSEEPGATRLGDSSRSSAPVEPAPS